jgi:hypothetical protein
LGIDRLQLFNKKLAEKLLLQREDDEFISAVCLSEAKIYLDYYGCFAHLGYEWENTISSLEFFPDCEDGETFILLLPEHVDEIVKSLRENIKILTVTGEKQIDEILKFKEICAANDGLMVAYMFDF